MRYLLCAALLLLSAPAWAQGDESRVYKETEVVFYGIDFTGMKFIHHEGFIDKNGKPMCNTLTFKYFTEWNEMFIMEKDKFNIAEFFAVPKVTLDLDVALERNKSYPYTEDCITNDVNYALTPEDIGNVVKHYGQDDAGPAMGLVLVMESMNKVDARGILHAVFFDRTDHTVLKSTRVEGPPSGYGFRNYWVNAIHNCLERNAAEYKKKRKAMK